MHGKILIVDAIATNRIVLKVKLTAAYYDVFQAGTIEDGLAAVGQVCPDVIICAAQFAESFTAAVRAQINGRDLPIVALDSNCDFDMRNTLLAAGVDDVLSGPLNEALLLARIRSLVRAYSSDTEWQLREDTSRALGLPQTLVGNNHTANAVLVSDDLGTTRGWLGQLRKLVPTQLSMVSTQKALSPFGQVNTQGDPDAFVLVVDDSDPNEMLRLLACIRAHNDTRHCGVMVLMNERNPMIAAQALDLGANDLMYHGFNAQEMALRLRTLVQRKQIAEQLRKTVLTGLEAAICDPLTGLHNRRYAMPHLDRIAETAVKTGKSFAVMVADMDYFKQINDVYGHAAGDEVLIETARRLRENLRAVDLVARIGGEEFLIVMPGIDLAEGRNAAQRLRQIIGESAFQLPGNNVALNVTMSIGLAIGGAETLRDSRHAVSARSLLDRADQALYRAKTNGRNQVTLSQPAA